MHRRTYLAGLSLIGVLAGCSELEEVVNSHHAIGESVTFDNGIEVQAVAHRPATEMTATAGGLNHTFEAPSQAIYALFELRVENTDITRREAPVVNIRNYDQLESEEGVIEIVGVNDIRVFGSGEPGYLPDGHQRSLPYDTLTVEGDTLDPYPHQPGAARPRLGPEQSMSGWVYGVIGRDATPELTITFHGDTERWAAETEN